MPMRLHSIPGQACLQGGGAGLGSKAGMATGLGLGPCGTGGTMTAVGGGACPQTGGALAAKGLGVKVGAGTGLGLGPCGVAGKTALGVKGATATTVAWSAGSGAGTAAGHGISLGLGLGLGAWGPVLLGAGIVALGYHFYANRNQGPRLAPKDELAAALNGGDT